MSRAQCIRLVETLSNIDVWLDDPDITELRKKELLASRDRIAAIKTAAIMNGVVEEKNDGKDKEVVDVKNKKSKRSKVRQAGCVT